MTDECLRIVDGVRTDLRMALEALRHEAERDLPHWPDEAREVWERERDRIEESMGEIAALVGILDDAWGAARGPGREI